ncbi:glycosyltransferase family 2 protein [Pseudomonas sp. AL03]|uniref:glycosyltransferase family 2 protein n=1 Tax=Pseudomonas sp. AL03 TaxID=3042230 RepID=UPI00249BBF01|nr:glycosyltransferase family 2 protein [Pseudomonas sp. AL03]MDI3275622.1 glycosyltransferase family 2 protein [Pseudomonas sp. AL03]
MTYSIIIPVYKNAESIPRLIQALSEINESLNNEVEAVFVVDGSPDASFELIQKELPNLPFAAQLIAHSRNFGSFPAIRTGLMAATGEYFGVMAADLQEPPELLISFFQSLSNDECDVAIGTRNARKDPFFSRLASSMFWGLYRKLVVHDMPKGGVDIFGCNNTFKEQLLKLEESRSSLIALIFWLGFRRKFVDYDRQTRQEGKSAWTFKKKLEYMMDSVFAFTDYPIRLLIKMGAIGSLMSAAIGLLVIIARIHGTIAVPGYAATMVVVLLLGTLNLLGLGLVGTYAWRAYENTKQRPLAVVSIQLNNREQISHV